MKNLTRALKKLISETWPKAEIFEWQNVKMATPGVTAIISENPALLLHITDNTTYPSICLLQLASVTDLEHYRRSGRIGTLEEYQPILKQDRLNYDFRENLGDGKYRVSFSDPKAKNNIRDEPRTLEQIISHFQELEQGEVARSIYHKLNGLLSSYLMSEGGRNKQIRADNTVKREKAKSDILQLVMGNDILRLELLDTKSVHYLDQDFFTEKYFGRDMREFLDGLKNKYGFDGFPPRA